MKRQSGFQEIPGIGVSLARDIASLGFRSIEELRGQDPEAMYEQLQARVGAHIDRCVLYAFRCAVYYAEGGRDPEKLKWWRWKDQSLA